MITVEAQGKEFTFPDGTSPEQMGAAIDEFFASQQPINSDLPLTPEQLSQLSPEQLQQYQGAQQPQASPDRSLMDYAKGAGETALTIGTGLFSPANALVEGALQAGQEVMSGQFGTNEAADRIQGRFERGMEAATYTPKTETGQAMVQGVGEFVEGTGLDTLPPVLPATALNAQRGLQQSVKGAQELRQLKTADIRQAIQDGSKYYVDKKIDPKTGRIVDDRIAKNAQNQQISDETIRQTKSLDAGTRKQAQRVLDRGAEVLEFGEKGKGRPNVIIGERVMKRFDTVLDANKKAGRDINNAVDSMKNDSFDIPDVIDEWEDSLNQLGVTRVDGKLNFKGSDIELNPSTIKVIKTVDNRLKTNYSAKDLHKEKQFIANAIYDAKADVNVPFSDAGEKALDKLRDGFNQKLRDASPDYADANDRFRETITTLNDFKKSMGAKQFNPYSDRVDNSVGQEVRKVLSNYRKGQDISDSIKKLNEMSAKYGGKYDDDIIELTRFYDSLENEFKTFASGSMKGMTRDAMKDVAGVAFDTATGAPIQAGKGAIKAGSKLFKKDVTEKTRVKALKDLLNEK